MPIFREHILVAKELSLDSWIVLVCLYDVQYLNRSVISSIIVCLLLKTVGCYIDYVNIQTNPSLYITLQIYLCLMSSIPIMWNGFFSNANDPDGIPTWNISVSLTEIVDFPAHFGSNLGGFRALHLCPLGYVSMSIDVFFFLLFIRQEET